MTSPFRFPRYSVPVALRETLADLIIAFSLEKPKDLAEFGVQFFQRLQKDGQRKIRRWKVEVDGASELYRFPGHIFHLMMEADMNDFYVNWRRFDPSDSHYVNVDQLQIF